MEFNETLIGKGVEKLFDWIDDLEFAIIKGLLYIIIFVLFLWFIFYFLGYQAFNGYWIRTLVIIGIWLTLEFAYWLGGGHDN